MPSSSIENMKRRVQTLSDFFNERQSSSSITAPVFNTTSSLTIIHPSPRLCTSCACFPWPPRSLKVNGMFTGELPFKKSFYHLQKTADRGCLLCQFAWLSLVNACTVTNDITKSLTKGSVKLGFYMNNDLLTLSSQTTNWGETIHHGIVTRFEVVDSNDMEFLGGMDSRRIQAFNGNAHEELNQLVEQQIRPWMRSCLQQQVGHRGCDTDNNTSALPTRLVDVGQVDDSHVRLIDLRNSKDGQDFAYLILSYCWGKGNSSSKTTNTNLEGRSRGFKVMELGKTVQDAIFLTRMMGYRYLWVDAICIIQGSRGDFQSESPKMRDYYSNAACCISVSVANDSSEGFLTPRPLARYPMENFSIRVPNDTTGYSIFKPVGNNWFLKRALLESPLTKRGWCLQETALSKRILHWTLQGLYRECRSSLFLEDAKIPWKDFVEDKTPTPRTVLALPDNEVLFSHGWYELVSLFSATHLTYETDRLYAIHGIASLLVQRLKVEYFNDLFRPSLAQGLLWCHEYDSHGVYMRPNEERLPSWCWASNCPVKYIKIYQKPLFVRDDYFGRFSQWPTTPRDTSIVESPVPRLCIRAPIIQIMIGRDSTGYTEHMSLGQRVTCKYRYYLDKRRQVMRNMGRSKKSEDERGQGMSVLWLPVGRVQSAYPTVVGLLISQLPNEAKGTYCRYGILKCHNFRGIEDEEFPDRCLYLLDSSVDEMLLGQMREIVLM